MAFARALQGGVRRRIRENAWGWHAAYAGGRDSLSALSPTRLHRSGDAHRVFVSGGGGDGIRVFLTPMGFGRAKVRHFVPKWGFCMHGGGFFMAGMGPCMREGGFSLAGTGSRTREMGLGVAGRGDVGTDRPHDGLGRIVPATVIPLTGGRGSAGWSAGCPRVRCGGARS